jgi:hypothetical protein
MAKRHVPSVGQPDTVNAVATGSGNRVGSRRSLG